MTASTDARKRILLHFLLGIALPAALLAYLAFRGIQNDRALVERENLNEQRRTVALIGEDIELVLSGAQADLYEAIAIRPASESALVATLDRLERETPVIDAIFQLETSGVVHLPAAKLLFSDAAGDPQPRTSNPYDRLSAEIALGERYEFREQDNDQAVAAYRRALALAADDQTKGELLSAIARVQAKSGDLADAVTTYETVASDFGHAHTGGGFSLGAATRLELASLQLATQDAGAALGTSVDLYHRLLEGEWALTEPQFNFLLQQAKEFVAEAEAAVGDARARQAYAETLGSLREREQRRLVQTRRLLVFRERGGRALLARMSRLPARPLSDSRRFAIEIGGQSYLTSVMGRGDPAGATDGGAPATMASWGILFDTDQLLETVLVPVIERHTIPLDLAWAVTGAGGEFLRASDEAPTEQPSLRAELPESPPWSLELDARDPRLIETFLTSRRGVYFYSFLLLAGIFVFGLTFTIRTVNQQLRLARMQSDFVSTISHEFKSPLTAIRQLAEMLENKRVPSEERRQRYYEVLLEQSERLSLLIDNILDFARMEEGKDELELESVDLPALVEEITSHAQHRVGHEGFSIRAEVDETLKPVSLDTAAISQAIRNLIDNAVKYSGESREVIVRSYSDNGDVVIAVQDFGIGIEDEELEHVFERFYRGGDPLTRTVKGTGLGLTLVQQIAEAHGGTVEIESEPGRGSTFRLKLPVDPPPTARKKV